jgi:XTP/dITP diphosphohydrolase
MLLELKDVSDFKRTARFRTVLAFVNSDSELCEEGIIEGEITKSVFGKDGFGYDPIFKPKNYSITFAEMSAEEKNRISHRARALVKMKKTIKKYFKNGDSIE